MPYHVHTDPGVAAYIADFEGISDEAKENLVDGYTNDLSLNADGYLASDPIAHESLSFWYEYAFLEGGFAHTFSFIVDGSRMSYGIVWVRYVEHERYP
jgi:hypothetical protein